MNYTKGLTSLSFSLIFCLSTNESCKSSYVSILISHILDTPAASSSELRYTMNWFWFNNSTAAYKQVVQYISLNTISKINAFSLSTNIIQIRTDFQNWFTLHSQQTLFVCWFISAFYLYKINLFKIFAPQCNAMLANKMLLMLWNSFVL